MSDTDRERKKECMKNYYHKRKNFLNHLINCFVFSISLEDIYRLIKRFDPNKASRQDEIYAKILKFCIPSVCKPLTLIFKSCLGCKDFPSV